LPFRNALIWPWFKAKQAAANVGELVYFDIRPVGSGWDSIQWTPLSLPPGISYNAYETLFEFVGSPSEPGTFEYSVTGFTNSGCRDTVTFSQSYICFPDGDMKWIRLLAV